MNVTLLAVVSLQLLLKFPSLEKVEMLWISQYRFRTWLVLFPDITFFLKHSFYVCTFTTWQMWKAENTFQKLGSPPIASFCLGHSLYLQSLCMPLSSWSAYFISMLSWRSFLIPGFLFVCLFFNYEWHFIQSFSLQLKLWEFKINILACELLVHTRKSFNLVFHVVLLCFV